MPGKSSCFIINIIISAYLRFADFLSSECDHAYKIDRRYEYQPVPDFLGKCFNMLKEFRN
jgi:hypothetical protein